MPPHAGPVVTRQRQPHSTPKVLRSTLLESRQHRSVSGSTTPNNGLQPTPSSVRSLAPAFGAAHRPALDVGQDHIDWQTWNQWIDNFQTIR